MIRLLAPLLAVVLASAVAPGCAHRQTSTGAEGLKPVVEAFHQRVRWRDYATAAQFITPDRRDAFEEARRLKKDEKELAITDFELEGIRMATDGLSAQVRSRMNWTRLPSVTENSEGVVSDFVWRESQWLLVRQRGGPFDAELSAEWTPPEVPGADGGTK